MGGVPIPPPPAGVQMAGEIQVVLAGISDEDAGMPDEDMEDSRWHPYNHAGRRQHFNERHARDLVSYVGSPPASAMNNTQGRRLW